MHKLNINIVEKCTVSHESIFDFTFRPLVYLDYKWDLQTDNDK